MMEIILGFFLALFLSILLVPALMKYSSQLRLVDAPNIRKIHAGLIPRVGGIGIALSTIVPCFLLISRDSTFLGFFLSATIIVVFGVLDDRFDLDFRLKFLGQAAAAGVAIVSGISIQHLPLFGFDAIPAIITYPITIVFLIGVTNAFNLLDGLDGLAAGSAMLSLAAISFLAALAGDGRGIVIITVTAIGGILGFLRYNTHPAIVFMGDAGSQFLGFSVAALSIMLIEKTQNAMSPAIILPLLGLPILDTTMVTFIRLREGRSPFSPDRNHIHHKLLALGLKHHQAVALIYGLQSLMVLTAYLLRFEADLTILLTYLGICAACIVSYRLLRRKSQRAPHTERYDRMLRWRSIMAWRRWSAILRPCLLRYIGCSIAVYLVIGAFIAVSTPIDISMLAFGLAGITIVVTIFFKEWVPTVIRLSSYLAAIYVSYLSATSLSFEWINSVPFNIWLATVAAAVAFVVAFAPHGQFQLSTLDLLIVLAVIGVLAVPIPYLDQATVSRVVIRSLVMMYACESILASRTSGFAAVGASSILSLLFTGAHLFH